MSTVTIDGAGRGGRERSLIGGSVRLIGDAGLTVVADAEVHPAEPVFVGHYPGFPVLPGVVVIEYVRRAARLGAGRPAVGEFDIVESARFLGPVVPGDRLRIDIRWAPQKDDWCVLARVSSEQGLVARLRLHYPAVGENT